MGWVWIWRKRGVKAALKCSPGELEELWCLLLRWKNCKRNGIVRDDEESLLWAYSILKSSSNPVNSTPSVSCWCYAETALLKWKLGHITLLDVARGMFREFISDQRTSLTKGREQKRPVTHRELQLVLCKWIEGSKREESYGKAWNTIWKSPLSFSSCQCPQTKISHFGTSSSPCVNHSPARCPPFFNHGRMMA